MGNTVLLPCEFCDMALQEKDLMRHQRNCNKNDTKHEYEYLISDILPFHSPTVGYNKNPIHSLPYATASTIITNAKTSDNARTSGNHSGNKSNVQKDHGSMTTNSAEETTFNEKSKYPESDETQTVFQNGVTYTFSPSKVGMNNSPAGNLRRKEPIISINSSEKSEHLCPDDGYVTSSRTSSLSPARFTSSSGISTLSGDASPLMPHLRLQCQHEQNSNDTAKNETKDTHNKSRRGKFLSSAIESWKKMSEKQDTDGDIVSKQTPISMGSSSVIDEFHIIHSPKVKCQAPEPAEPDKGTGNPNELELEKVKPCHVERKQVYFITMFRHGLSWKKNFLPGVRGSDNTEY